MNIELDQETKKEIFRNIFRGLNMWLLKKIGEFFVGVSSVAIVGFLSFLIGAQIDQHIIPISNELQFFQFAAFGFCSLLLLCLFWMIGFRIKKIIIQLFGWD